MVELFGLTADDADGGRRKKEQVVECQVCGRRVIRGTHGPCPEDKDAWI